MGQVVAATCDASRQAAQECSPGREPREAESKAEPPRGEIKWSSFQKSCNSVCRDRRSPESILILTC